MRHARRLASCRPCSRTGGASKNVLALTCQIPDQGMKILIQVREIPVSNGLEGCAQLRFRRGYGIENVRAPTQSAMDRAMRIALVLWQPINFACHLVPQDLGARSSEHHPETKHLSRFLQGQWSDTHSPPKRRGAVDLRSEGLQQGWHSRSLSRRQEDARHIIRAYRIATTS